MADRELFFDINGFSKHIDTPDELSGQFEYNEENPGFGITAETNGNSFIKSLMAGGYKNSYGKPSYYAGGALGKRFGDEYYMDVGGFGGVTTGYGDIERTYRDSKGRLRKYESPYNDINPMAGIYMNLGKKDLGRLGLKYMPGKPNLFMMNLGIPFK